MPSSLGKEVSAAVQRVAKAQAVRREGRGRVAWQAVIEAEVWQAVTAATVLRAVIAARASRGVMAEAVSPEATEVAVWTTATVRTEE